MNINWDSNSFTKSLGDCDFYKQEDYFADKAPRGLQTITFGLIDDNLIPITLSISSIVENFFKGIVNLIGSPLSDKWESRTGVIMLKYATYEVGYVAGAIALLPLGIITS